MVTMSRMVNNSSRDSNMKVCGLRSGMLVLLMLEQVALQGNDILFPQGYNRHCEQTLLIQCNSRTRCLSTRCGKRALSAMDVIGRSLEVSELSFDQSSSCRVLRDTGVSKLALNTQVEF